MVVTLAVIAFLGGLAALTVGADKFVDGAAALAARLGVGTLVVGIVVVGFSTSAPEMLVAAVAAVDDSPAIAVGNAIGSNITNIALVLGATVLVCPITVSSGILRRELPTMSIAVVAASLLLYVDGLRQGDGVILLSGLVVALGLSVYFALTAERFDPLTQEFQQHPPPDVSIPTACGLLALGLVLLVGGSRALVYGAGFIARTFGVPELVIGLTIVAIGTSLPELAASVAGARRGHPEMALGNIIGSNMFNSLGVLAMPALIAPGAVDGAALARDIPFMLVLTVLLYAVIFSRDGASRITRGKGTLLVGSFVAYQLLLYFGVGG